MTLVNPTPDSELEGASALPGPRYARTVTNRSPSLARLQAIASLRVILGLLERCPEAVHGLVTYDRTEDGRRCLHVEVGVVDPIFQVGALLHASRDVAAAAGLSVDDESFEAAREYLEANQRLDLAGAEQQNISDGQNTEKVNVPSPTSSTVISGKDHCP